MLAASSAQSWKLDILVCAHLHAVRLNSTTCIARHNDIESTTSGMMLLVVIVCIQATFINTDIVIMISRAVTIIMIFAPSRISVLSVLSVPNVIIMFIVLFARTHERHASYDQHGNRASRAIHDHGDQYVYNKKHCGKHVHAMPGNVYDMNGY